MPPPAPRRTAPAATSTRRWWRPGACSSTSTSPTTRTALTPRATAARSRRRRTAWRCRRAPARRGRPGVSRADPAGRTAQADSARYLTAGLPVVHGFTTRAGGVSGGPFASLNLGLSSGDERAQVEENRDLLLAELGFAR